jgi:hypothetical protein
VQDPKTGDEVKQLNKLGLCLGVALVLIQTGCGELTSDEVDAKILASEKLPHIDKVCNELPKPESFKLTKKRLSGNSDKSMIIYQYVSRESFSSIQTFFVEHAPDAGYAITGGDSGERLLNDIKLERAGVAVVVENRPPSGTFSVGCIQ